MATIQDLFKKQNKDLYGLSGKAIIESRGLINPPRGAALLTSSPNAIADLIGNQIGGALKGSANRPSDTIFDAKKGNSPLNKPISLFKTQESLKYAVEKGTDYIVKETPAPASIIANLQQGGSSAGGMAAGMAIKGLTKGGLKDLSNSLKKKPAKKGYSNKNPYSQNKIEWDKDNVVYVDKIEDDKLIKTLEEYGIKNQVLVLFQKYGKTTSIPFSGTITGISEDISPEWSNFKYLGSPYKVNRYQGVERSLKFNLKLYYLSPSTKTKMIQKINYLKSLAFPYDEISEMTYGDNKQSSQYAFAPNLVYLTIGDLYRNLFGYIESLSFSIEDNTTWPTLGIKNEGAGKEGDNYMYPSVMDVSISLKIIENHKTEKDKDGIVRYKYDFDGRGDAHIEEVAGGKKKLESNPEPPQEKAEIKKEDKPVEPKKLSSFDIYARKKRLAFDDGRIEKFRPWLERGDAEKQELDAWYPDEAVIHSGETKG